MSIDLPPDMPAVKADRRALRQVLLNLLSNSVKFTPAGGHIALEAIRDSGGGIGFRVRDTGIGIAAGGHSARHGAVRTSSIVPYPANTPARGLVCRSPARSSKCIAAGSS